MRQVILLTGCVNPAGMTHTKLTDVSVRKKQYEDAINWYLQNTSLPIVFCENSNTPLNIIDKRLEMLCFEGNKDKEKGKGYGEMEIIEYAIKYSRFITNESIVVKITGRLLIKNINTIIFLHRIFGNCKSVVCQLHSNLQFADSRIFISSASFLKDLTHQKENLNDSAGYYFEHLLAANLKGMFFPFIIRPAIQGESGTTREKYNECSTSLKETFQYFKYQMYLLKKLRTKKE